MKDEEFYIFNSSNDHVDRDLGQAASESRSTP